MLECSSCRKEIVGIGVVLADELEGNHENFVTYHGELPDGEKTSYFLLHPVCFIDIFNEIVRQEKEAAISVYVAVAGNIREALAIS